MVCSALGPLLLGGPLRAPGPAALLVLGLAPGPPVGPSPPAGAAAAASGPLRSLWVAAGVAAACRRPACARRRGPRAPPAAPAAAWAAPAPGGFRPAGASVPSSAGLAPRLLSLAAPWRGRCASAAGRLRPCSRRAGAPSRGPCRAAPLVAVGRRASSSRGGGWAAAPPFFASPPPRSWGAGARPAWARGQTAPRVSRVKTSGRAALDPLGPARQRGGHTARPGPPGKTGRKSS